MQPIRYASCCALAFLLVTGTVFAEPAAMPINRYTSGELPQDNFDLSRAKVGADQHFGAQVALDYAANPLVWRNNGGSEVEIISDQTTAVLAASYSLWNRAAFFAAMPVVLQMSGAAPNQTAQLETPQVDSGGPGDLYFGGRVLAVGGDNEAGAFALQAAISVPTAGSFARQYYLGDEYVTFRPKIMGELHPGAQSRIVLNLGAVVRDDYEGMPYDVTDELTFALGFGIPVWTSMMSASSRLEAVAYVRGNTTFVNAFSSAYTPVEAVLGARYEGSRMTFGLAAGAGISSGMGAPDFRLVLTAGFIAPVLDALSSSSQSTESAKQ